MRIGAQGTRIMQVTGIREQCVQCFCCKTAKQHTAHGMEVRTPPAGSHKNNNHSTFPAGGALI
jgi:hypothetical protein